MALNALLVGRSRPSIFLISTMAMHTHKLKAHPRASLPVTQQTPTVNRSLIQGHAGRKCLSGTQHQLAEVCKLYMERDATASIG